MPPGGQAYQWRPPAGAETYDDKAGRPHQLPCLCLEKSREGKGRGGTKNQLQPQKKRDATDQPRCQPRRVDSIAPSRHQLTGEFFWPSAAWSTLKSLLAKVWGAPRFPPFFLAGNALAVTGLLPLLPLLLLFFLLAELLAPKDPRMAAVVVEHKCRHARRPL